MIRTLVLVFLLIASSALAQTSTLSVAPGSSIVITVSSPAPPPPPPLLPSMTLLLDKASTGKGTVYGLFVNRADMKAPTVTVEVQPDSGSSFKGFLEAGCVLGLIQLSTTPITCTATFTSP